jgi:hypothetical protein
MSLLDRLHAVQKGPLATAGILGAPLFFCSLMASSLAIARPRVVTWTHKGRLISVYHNPSSAVELRIWLWALVPLAILLGVGLLASLWRYGLFVSCAAGIALALAVTHNLPKWELHHAARWPRGIDNIPDTWSSDQVPRGDWEKRAGEAAYSLSHWTIGLALVIALVYALVLRRRARTRSRIELAYAGEETPTAVGAPSTTLPPIPE